MTAHSEVTGILSELPTTRPLLPRSPFLANQLVAKRVPVKAAQERLGHSRPGITFEHYAQVLDESAREVAEVLSNQLGPKVFSGKRSRTLQ